MTTMTLRPLSLGELLDASFSLYRQLFPSLIVVALITSGPPLVVDVFITQAGGAIQNPILWVGNLVFSMVAGAIGVGASTHIVSDNYLGERLNPGAAFGRVVPYALRMVVLSFLTSFAVGLGFILLFVPGIIVACGLSVATTALVLEGLGSPIDAMSRSWSLTRGYRGKVFFALLIAFLLIGIPTLALGMIAALVGTETLLTVVGTLLAMLVTPFLYVTITVIYYDLRVRKEGFDLDMLAQHLRG